MSKEIKKKRFIKFFWWSLLFHIIILLLILFYAFKDKKLIKLERLLTPEQIKKLEEIAKIQKKKVGELPASLKPRKSTFGTTVIFDETPSFQPAKTQILAQEDLIKGQPEKKQLEQQKKVEDLQKVQEAQVKPKELKETKKIKESKKETLPKPEVKPEQKLALPEIGLKEIKTEQELLKEQKERELGEDLQKLKKTALDQKAIQKRIEQIAQQQKKLENAKGFSNIDAEKMRQTGTSLVNRGPITTKNKKSIIAATVGFVENLKNEGNDWIERKGDDSKRPSFEELKYISYETKINWHLQNAWKQNFAYKPYNKILEGTAVIDFYIKKDGSVTDLTLLQSTGNPELDKMILKSVELASPFPPVPDHFGTNLYKTGRIIYVNAYKVKF